MRITGGLAFDLVHQGFVSSGIVCVDGRDAWSQSCGEGEAYDAAGCYVIPGLTDLHFHGGVGAGLLRRRPRPAWRRWPDYELCRGVTQICPAGMTLGEDQLTQASASTAAAHRGENRPGARSWCGVHLEGPFLC